MFRGLLALALGLLLTLSSASAQDRWVLLGSGEIAPSAREPSIALDATRPIKQVRLVATKGGITLSKVVVSYRDGRTHAEERRINLVAGERTKPIDPRAEAAVADRLMLVVDEGAKTEGVARLEVWGLASAKKAPAVAQPDDVAALSEQIAQLHQAGKYAKALAIQRTVAARTEKAEKNETGKPGPKTAEALGALAWYALFARDFAGALKAAERAHSLAPDLLLIETNRAHALLFLGRRDEARALYLAHMGKRPLGNSDAIWEDVLTEDFAALRQAKLDHEAFNTIVEALGIDNSVPKREIDALNEKVAQLHRVGKHGDAVVAAEQYVALARRRYGENRLPFADASSWLAVVYESQGRHGDAEHLYQRSLAIKEKALGPDHVDVATSLSNLANLYYSQQRYADAEPLWKRSLEIRETALGADHLDVGRSLNDLAVLYWAQGRYAEAEPLHKRALAIGEKALGPDHPEVGISLNNLGRLYENLKRYADAEPLYKRSLAIVEKALGPDHPFVGGRLKNLAALYLATARTEEAEPLYKRALSIFEKALEPDDRQIADALNDLGEMYRTQGRYAEAEPLYTRAVSIYEKRLGPDRPDVGTALNNLALLYAAQGRYADAESSYNRSLVIREKNLGLDHPDVAIILANLAGLYFEQSDWARAADLFQKSTRVLQRRAERGLASTAHGADAGREASLSSAKFWRLVKATYRLAQKGRLNQAKLAEESFETAQWAQSSEVAASLAEMAARSVKGDSILAELVRERQDLVVEWQAKDKQLTLRKSEVPDKRNQENEMTLADRLAVIDRRLAEIDARFANEFKEYAALASPMPISVANVQEELRDNEALVLFLNTPQVKPTPDETFIWVVTKTAIRWLRSDLGTMALLQRVTRLRCGLDRDGEWQWSAKKNRWLGRKPPCQWLRSEGLTKSETLPFDLATAFELYKGLFMEVEDLINDKQLLVVPSGSLTSLPFQVLVTELPGNASYGESERDVGLLGAELTELSEDRTKHLSQQSAILVIKPIPGGPAEAAGLRTNDVILSLDGSEVGGLAETISKIQAHAPFSSVQLRLLREGKQIDLEVKLGTTREWKPYFWENATRDIAWLIKRHAITVLPSASGLAALRRDAKVSAAPEPFIGFGNPALSLSCGSVFIPDKCPEDEIEAAANMPSEISRSVGSVNATKGFFRNGLADVVAVKASLCPLPDTEHELKCVARSLGAPDSSIVLAHDMTEAALKKTALEKYRVIHFATHGLLAGETAQLAENRAEPSLVFSPPETATEEDDGLLTASEVARLRMDAEFVVMSACNTAGGGEPGAEALSGLAKAFFYAGARALLVSHWPVNSYAATTLTSRTFAELKRDPGLGRSEAFRRAMLALMSDKDRPWAAHPSVWAPFVVVGEGGVQGPH